jgi:hypothetical protein
MIKRTTYDDVEDEAIRQRRKGHDIKLYFRYTGMLHVFHNGEKVLEDGPRDYSVAFAKLQSIGAHETPELEPNDNVTDKSVRRGKQTRTKKAVAKKVAAEKSKARNMAAANAAAAQENGNN